MVLWLTALHRMQAVCVAVGRKRLILTPAGGATRDRKTLRRGELWDQHGRQGRVLGATWSIELLASSLVSRS